MTYRKSHGGILAGCIAALAIMPLAASADDEKDAIFTGIGIAVNKERADQLGASGLDFLTVATGDFLVPDQDDETFAEKLALIKNLKPPVMAVNSFIRPRHLKCVGPDANHDQVMEWAETVFRRAGQAGIRFVVFGSSGTRRVPEGWPLDRARAQFVEVLKRMGPAAQTHNVVVVVEQLQPSECNFLNHIRDAAEIVRAAGHPNVRLLADLYHMRRAGDTPADLRAAADVLVHVEIAVLRDRTIPGTDGDDFRPFFNVLREIGYSGLITVEAGKWTADQIPKAIAEIRRQERE